MTDTLFLTGARPVTIEVERKRIRNMYLHVNPEGRVSISAPLSFTEEEIRAFVLEKADWIDRQLSGMRDIPVRRECLYETGDTLFLWGEPYELTFLPDRTKTLTVSDAEKKIYLAMPATSSGEQRKQFVDSRMKLRLTRAIAMRMPHYEQQMGLYARAFQVRAMKTRWGSCNTGNAHLHFNLSLVALPPECLDYVIVHELAHLRYAGHNEAFWALVERYRPDYKRIKQEMKQAEKELGL